MGRESRFSAAPILSDDLEEWCPRMGSPWDDLDRGLTSFVDEGAAVDLGLRSRSPNA